MCSRRLTRFTASTRTPQRVLFSFWHMQCTCQSKCLSCGKSFFPPFIFFWLKSSIWSFLCIFISTQALLCDRKVTANRSFNFPLGMLLMFNEKASWSETARKSWCWIPFGFCTNHCKDVWSDWVHSEPHLSGRVCTVLIVCVVHQDWKVWLFVSLLWHQSFSNLCRRYQKLQKIMKPW